MRAENKPKGQYKNSVLAQSGLELILKIITHKKLLLISIKLL